MPSSGNARAGARARKRSEGSEALAQLQRGEITLDAYLDLRADESVSGLRGRISPEKLRLVRDEVREQLAEDPVLVEMLRQITGSLQRREPAK
jgi:hypothetical protein